GQMTTDETSIRPFSAVTITGPDSGAVETITLVLTSMAGLATDANGTLSGIGLTKFGEGTYALNGTADAVTEELDALTFTPTAHEATPGQTVTTGITIMVSNGDAASTN